MKKLQEELLRARACEYVLGHQICLVTARVLNCKCIYKCSLRNGIQEVNLKTVCTPFIRMMLGSRSTGVRQWPLTTMLPFRGNLTVVAERSICSSALLVGRAAKKTPIQIAFPFRAAAWGGPNPFSHLARSLQEAFFSSPASLALAEEKWLMTLPVLSVVQKHGLQLWLWWVLASLDRLFFFLSASSVSPSMVFFFSWVWRFSIVNISSLCPWGFFLRAFFLL